MAKDTLKQLDRDVDRWLFAGAQIARTDPNLAGARDTLAPLAARAPALGKVVEQIDKLQTATGKAAASELLALASLMAQVRGAQATPALPESNGELTPLPPTRKIGTPLTPTELNTLVGALTNAPDARQRSRVIRDYAMSDRGAARDLRLLPLVIPALADGAIAEVVVQYLVPALGEAIVPSLQRHLDLEKGRALDVRVLRAIARIEGAKATDLLREAVEKGVPDIRAAAIAELGRIDPLAAEPIAIVLAEKDRSKDVRVAAVHALAGAPSDEALDVLLRAFGGTAELRSAAESSLAASKHPRADERIVALFSPELRDLGHFRIKKATTKEEKDAAAKEQKAHTNQIEYLVDLVDLLTARGTDEGANLVLEAFRRHKVKDVRDAAARALLRIGFPGAWEELMPSLYDAPDATKEDFVRGVIALDPAKAHERLARFFEPGALAQKNGTDLATRILARIGNHFVEYEENEDGTPGNGESPEAIRAIRNDERWVDLAVAMLGNTNLRTPALMVLANANAPKTLGDALSVSRQEGLSSEDALLVFVYLGKQRDPRILHAFLRLLEPLRGGYEYGRACNIMTAYDDPALAPMLRSWLDAKQKRKRLSRAEAAPFEECLRFLERARTAASTDD
ncbi:HEAT repeat domain-containing protein [Polyangium sp. 15x6]|uniref:HEAT repeat domain-containing protein n=1 Tax=Polyangium sp. 15x6 TaxID=3042687 RepID=UPI00249B8E30|nr:HEAT repeat domain-containing protein [Polyangium sp. 15x6]MDI3284751.1 HEAT repeat domain-containing protein [Polyangium sp. 15x6]